VHQTVLWVFTVFGQTEASLPGLNFVFPEALVPTLSFLAFSVDGYQMATLLGSQRSSTASTDFWTEVILVMAALSRFC
jgi:hypothetical protein